MGGSKGLIFCGKGCGQVSEWLKETDCKSVSIAYDGSNPSLPTKNLEKINLLEILISWDLPERCEVVKLGFYCGSSSVGRASASQAECREFEPLLPLQKIYSTKKNLELQTF